MLVDEDGVSARCSVSSAGRSKEWTGKDSAKPILSAVTAEMAKPRVAKSARVPLEDTMKKLGLIDRSTPKTHACSVADPAPSIIKMAKSCH
jgi:hypothetical protein